MAPVVFLLLLMPIEYRAGADRPHPHASLQLVWEATHGAPRHHHVRQAAPPCDHDHRAGEPDHAGCASPDPDLAEASAAARATTAPLAVTLMPWLLFLMGLSHGSRRQPDCCPPPPDGQRHPPRIPPPKRAGCPASS
jgi:hypothetical protein